MYQFNHQDMNQTKPKKTHSDKPDYQPIYSHLKKLPYIEVESLVRTWFTRRVVGFEVSGSPHRKKRKTIQLVAKEIYNYELPLLVNDEKTSSTNSFRLMIKL